MLSCFINTNVHDNDIIKSIIIFIFLLLPFIIVCYGLFQMISIHKHIKLYKNNETFSLFKYYGLYIGVHLFLQFCIFLIYIIDYWEVTPSKPFKLISYLVTRLAICNPILVALVRLTQMNYNIRKFFSNCFKHKTPNNNNTERLTLIDANATEFEKLEINAIKQFVLNIYISVCYAMERSSKIINLGNIDESTCLETNEYRINKTKILQNKTSKLSSDIIVEQCDNFFIDIIEYAPKIFTYLRQIDKLNEDVIITSFLPMKNKQGIQESEGRSGNFFINTDDKRFILKTITYEDVELIRGILLEKMANHYKQHNDSIIGRIYGLYKLNITTGLFGKKEIYFILMENVYGVFENNVLCKYDLKGSQLDRKVNFDSEEIDNTVMKDVNFFEIEKGLLLNDANSRKIMTIAANDVTFLASQGIMDYSLLVVKLTFNKDETAEIFGKYHRKQTEKEVLNMLCPLTKDKMGNEDGSNDDTNINEDNLNFNRKHVRNLYKYIFPSLQPDKAYIVAIIDFFQLYDLRKKLETSFKGLRADTKIISSMPPDKYVVRFLNNLTNIAQGKEYLNSSLYTNKSHDKDKDKNKEKDNE